MGMRAARVPWNGGRKGRPPKKAPVQATGRPGCVWPVGDGTCRSGVQAGLAVCPEHAKILASGAGKECAWPACSQFAAFRALCPYHDKCARGLLEGPR